MPEHVRVAVVGSGFGGIGASIELTYIVGALRTMARTGAASVELRRPALAAWTAEIQAKAASGVWSSGGCSSWYLDAEGRNTRSPRGRDVLTPASRAAELAETIPGARLRTLRDRGHMLPLEAPDDIAAEIAALTGAAAGPATAPATSSASG